MSEYKFSTSDILKFRIDFIKKLTIVKTQYADLNKLCKNFIRKINNDAFPIFLLGNEPIFYHLMFVYENLDLASHSPEVKNIIIDTLSNVSNEFEKFMLESSKKKGMSIRKIYKNLNDISATPTETNPKESIYKEFYDFFGQEKLELLKNKVIDLSTAIKKITPEEIDDLNYAIKDTKNKAREIQKLENQINQKLTDWNSEHKNNLLAEYTELKEKFKNDIDTIKQEVEDVKTKTTSEIKQNIDLFTSDCKKKFDDSYTNFNQIHENNQERYQKLYDNVTESLANLNNEIQKEELAQYFQLECKKLKGKINPLIISFSLFLTIMFYQLLLGTTYYIKENNLDILFKPIVSFVSIWFISLIITQFISNLVTYNTESSERKKNNYFIFKSLANQDTIKELLTPYWCWLIFIFIGMYFIGHISYNVYTKNMQNAIHSIQDILPNMPFFMIMVWFTWFASKQFSYIKQICDEYEYKYALSKSYLSYKKEASELSTENKSLLVSLLDSVIRNISTSPVQSVKSDCHTPFGEVFNSLKSASDIIKKDKTTP